MLVQSDASIQIVPVLDLLDGRVVRAERGERANYRPIESVLTPSSVPADVVAGLLRHFPFAAIYIADLNAIQGTATNTELVRSLLRGNPEIQFWLDAGFDEPAKVEVYHDLPNMNYVFGTESQRSRDSSRELFASVRPDRAILSLDFHRGAALDPAGFYQYPDFWPQTVIVMELDQVGTGEGPNTERLALVKQVAGNRKVIAAGGVRHIDDIHALQRLGIEAALVGTALHEGNLDSATLASVSRA